MRDSRATYTVPAEEIRCTMAVLNSRFIASLAPVFTTDDARGFIARVRAEFPDATHNVPAYLIGGGEAVVAHCCDDGEPSGTVGRPSHRRLILKETFGVQVTVTLQLPVEVLESFQTALGELSNGKLHAEVMETCHVLMQVKP